MVRGPVLVGSIVDIVGILAWVLAFVPAKDVDQTQPMTYFMRCSSAELGV
jgi:hypothetical protein